MGKYKDNPWLGLESYQENQIIYGRNKEIEELSQCILNNKETVLFGKSGIGKSSIINAGILPIVRTHGYIPIVVRLNHSNKYSYIKQISDLIKKNVTVSDYLTTKQIEEQSLWEYFHTHRFNTRTIPKSKLVVIFDQFEEIFTLQNNPSIKINFFKELSDVLNDVMPKSLSEDEQIYIPSSNSKTESQKSVSSFADMADLFSCIAENINISKSKYIDDNNIHFIFTLREDFLSEFEYHTSKIPALKQHRYALRPLTQHQAAEIILRPRPDLVDEKVAKLLIETVTNRTDFSLYDEPEIDVDAAVLSLFLNQIFDKRANEKEPISINLIKTFGNDIIEDFYKNAVAGLSPQQISFLEEELLTGENRRDSLSISDFKAGGFSDSDLTRLIDNKKILRQFHYGGDLRVELIHDILCPIIKEQIEKRKIQKKQERERKICEEETRKLQEEAEKQRQLLIKEQEKQRQKNIEQRKKKNLERFKSSQNVLSIKGRRIWDNKSFTFSVDNTRSNTLQNSSERAGGNRSDKSSSASEGFGMDVTRTNTNENFGDLLIDQLLNQIVGHNGLHIGFPNSHSKDGISLFDIQTNCHCGKRRISSIRFFSNEDGKTNEYYTRDGICGIELIYNADGSELQRKYFCDKFTSVGIVSVKFEEYNSEGFPTCVMYYDKNDKPCAHIDGNYGVLIEYNEYGNETQRWFVDNNKNKTAIYNGVYGVCNQYDNEDRLISQYFVNEKGNRIYDIYRYHGVTYEYSEDRSFVRRYHIDTEGNLVNIKGYCLEELIYDKNNRVKEQNYYDKNIMPVERQDGAFKYSCMSIRYNNNDFVEEIKLIDKDGETTTSIIYDYYSNGLLKKQCFKGIRKSCGTESPSGISDNLDVSCLSGNGVPELRFEYTNQGFVKKISHWNYKGESISDINGIKSVNFSYDEFGRICERLIYKRNDELPEEKAVFEYYADGSCKNSIYSYEINEKRSWIDSLLNKGKHPIGLFNKYSITQKLDCELLGKINLRSELIEFECDENNEFISGKQLKVRQAFDEDGNLIEQRLLDRNTGLPIPDDDGVYGWRIENTLTTTKTIFLNKNYEIGDNKYGVAIIEREKCKTGDNTCEIVTYFNKSHEPVSCKEEFHRSETIYKDEDCLLADILYYDIFGAPTNCKDGFHMYKCEITENAEELIRIFRFVGSKGNPVISKEKQYHKRIETFSKEDGCLKSCTYYNTDDTLINCKEGYAKLKIKRDTSFSTYFHYPFCDHYVKRYYDSNDEKIDIEFEYKQKVYKAYKIITDSLSENLSNEKVYAIYDKNSQRKYVKYKFFWKYSYIVIIPTVTVLFLIAYMIYTIFSKFWKFLIKEKKEKYISKSSVIIVNELNEFENGFCPLKNFGIKPGAWIIKWNNWNYTTKENCISEFETEFNLKSKNRTIIFYNPQEAKITERFKEVKYSGDNIGAKLGDIEVETDSVNEMLELLSIYTKE